jgi:hypothetical protein
MSIQIEDKNGNLKYINFDNLNMIIIEYKDDDTSNIIFKFRDDTELISSTFEKKDDASNFLKKNGYKGKIDFNKSGQDNIDSSFLYYLNLGKTPSLGKMFHYKINTKRVIRIPNIQKVGYYMEKLKSLFQKILSL